ncbi:MAG TPA: type VI secretion system protein TssA [Aromatoleum sp.]|uniref:type VI secretion system protein TssA n=1 Tax=Aromatoleum sp. TaxID=2307007 RepID=UPI002B487EB0|nr:type VI secretion system protein TssA [Aromatoleum sp.]HJV27442.1 type VI secretion system protein TssA [Aromatoleum sp.]
MNLDELLRPLDGETPCGSDMMFSAEFDQINEARRFDDPSLAQGEWVAEHKEADWTRVVQLCEDLLYSRTKDVRVAVWMVEALAKTRGLAGMGEGFRVLAGLCEAYWPHLHPQVEDDDMEPRIGNLEWLAHRASRLVREFLLTSSPKGNYSTIDFESARALAQSIERSPGQADELAQGARLTLVQFDAARRDTAPRHFVDGVRDADLASAQVRLLQTVLDRFLGRESPSFAAVLDVLDDVRLRMKRYAAEAGATDAPAEVVPAAVAGRSAPTRAVGVVATPAVGGGGPIWSRAQAIRQLQEIAAFFRQTEPHSPVAYLADKAARWGSMSLHEWLRAVVKDDGALLHVEELLGVDPRVGESGH